MAEQSTAVETFMARQYLSLPRMVTHWHQADRVARCLPQGGTLLEVGKGSGHVAWMLKTWGYDVQTLDIDPALQPDIVGDVTNIPLPDGSVDCVLAAEVLEHLPFEQFPRALTELRRVSRQHVIVTLPAPLMGLSLLLNLPRLKPIGLSLGVPFLHRHRLGPHHWELGKRGFGLRKIRRIIRQCGFRIADQFRPAPSLYCYFFVLQRDETPIS